MHKVEYTSDKITKTCQKLPYDSKNKWTHIGNCHQTAKPWSPPPLNLASCPFLAASHQSPLRGEPSNHSAAPVYQSHSVKTIKANLVINHLVRSVRRSDDPRAIHLGTREMHLIVFVVVDVTGQGGDRQDWEGSQGLARDKIVRRASIVTWACQNLWSEKVSQGMISLIVWVPDLPIYTSHYLMDLPHYHITLKSSSNQICLHC